MHNFFPQKPGRKLISGLPEGADAQTIAIGHQNEGETLFVARNDVGLARMKGALKFFSPDIKLSKLINCFGQYGDNAGTKNSLLSLMAIYKII